MHPIKPRPGCKDIWNAFMLEGARYSQNDIPCCPTTAKRLPDSMITWKEARKIYRKEYEKDPVFHHESFVCFYLDDHEFDGPSGIWADPDSALKVLLHFAGIVTPDFSTYLDFPEPLKVYNTYRMRAFGYWIGRQGVAVINNVRWGNADSYRYCFDGIPKHSIVSIGTVASGLKLLASRPLFENGLRAMVETLKPHTVIVYGSASYQPLRYLAQCGISIVQFDSAMHTRFMAGHSNE